MADKPVISNISSTSRYSTTDLNDRFQALRDEFANVLGTNGVEGASNTMLGNIDMSGSKITNMSAPSAPNDAARLKDIQDLDLANSNSAVVDLRADLGVIDAATKAELSAETVPPQFINAIVAGRDVKADEGGGSFVWDATDISVATGSGVIATDTEEGIYVPPDSDTTGASGAWVRVYSGALNVAWFGMFGGGTSVANTTAHDAVIAYASAGDEIFYPSGAYQLDNSGGAKDITKELHFVLDGAATLTFASEGPWFIFSGDDTSLTGGALVGQGNTGTGGDGITITGDRARITSTDISNASSSAVRLTSSTDSVVDGCYLHNNYTYGVEDKLGLRNRISNNTITDNGKPATGNNPFGRGVVLWMSVGVIVEGNHVAGNTEYGIRLYSQAFAAGPPVVPADTQYLRHCIVTNNVVGSNGTATGTFGGGDDKAIEILVTQSGPFGPRLNTISNNTMLHDINGDLGQSNGLSIQGSFNNYVGNTLEGNGQTDAAIVIVNGEGNTIQSNNIKNWLGALTFGITPTPSSRNTIVGNIATDIEKGIPAVQGEGNIVTNNYFKHIGGATSGDDGIYPQSTGEDHSVNNNILDGFYRGLVLNDSYNTLASGNTTQNSVSIGGAFTVDSSADSVKATNNNFDSVTANYEAYASASGSADSTGFGRLLGFDSAIPTKGFFQIGDMVMNTSATSSGTAGWICTTGGQDTAANWSPIALGAEV